VVGSVAGATGAIYALRTELFSNIKPRVILDDLWIPMEVVMRGFRVVFEPDAQAIDTPALDQNVEKTRKVRTIAGNWQYMSWRQRSLNPIANPIWFQFVSHKTLRILAPAFMAVALVSHLLLSLQSRFFLLLLAPHLAVYAAGLIAMLIPKAQAIKACRIPMAFLSLNWFAVLGCIEYFKSRDTYLWNGADQQNRVRPSA
jgi:predicted metal-binding membrane protein